MRTSVLTFALCRLSFWRKGLVVKKTDTAPAALSCVRPPLVINRSDLP
jgi:hypothetical protein